MSRLIKLIAEMECAAIQLHYPESLAVIQHLRGHFGSMLEIFQVVTPETEFPMISPHANVVLIDKSFRGGTGQEHTSEQLTALLNSIQFPRVFLGGGISTENIGSYLPLPVQGLDVQSAVKSSHSSTTENTDLLLMQTLGAFLGYAEEFPAGQVGFVIQNLQSANQDLLRAAYNAKVDLLHVDISDGFVSEPTSISDTKALLYQIKSVTSHWPIQLHLFTETEASANRIITNLNDQSYVNLQIFTHINRNNFMNFSAAFVNRVDINFAVDVKDVIDETFPWEKFIHKSNLLVCLPSSSHKDRVNHLNQALKLIQVSQPKTLTVTIDRSIDYSVVSQLESTSNLNIVSGTYLKEDLSKRYNLIKSYLHDQH